MNTRKFERRGLIITETLMVLLAVLWAVPIYYLIVTTLKSPAEATASPLALPSSLNLQNYIDAWQKMEFPRAFANTLFITAMSVFLIVLFGSMAGYAQAALFCRKAFIKHPPGKGNAAGLSRPAAMGAALLARRPSFCIPV